MTEVVRKSRGEVMEELNGDSCREDDVDDGLTTDVTTYS